MSEINDFGYVEKAFANIREVVEKQGGNIHKAASMMADAICEDKLINVYAGGGHTTLAMGEMFFRAGGLANINPIMETALSVFNQALKYLELERTVNFGASIVKYYDLQKDDLLIIFHNIGINPATIDAAMEAKRRGVKIIAVASSCWQNEMPADHFIRLQIAGHHILHSLTLRIGAPAAAQRTAGQKNCGADSLPVIDRIILDLHHISSHAARLLPCPSSCALICRLLLPSIISCRLFCSVSVRIRIRHAPSWR